MTHMRLLPVSLNEDETKNYALKLADICAKRKAVEEERKKAAGEFNQKIKATNETIQDLVDAIQNGFEEKEVECDERKNLENNTMETIRLDNNEIIDTRELTADEMNVDLFDDDGENPDSNED